MTTLTETSLYLIGRLESFFASHDHFSTRNNLWGIYYGDQEKIPKNVTVCVEPNIKRTDLKNSQRGVSREFEIFVLVYFTSLNQTGQLNRRDADALAEEIEAYLNSDPQAGGSLIHCMVTEVASGYSSKDGTIVKSSRLTFNGTGTDRLPS